MIKPSAILTVIILSVLVTAGCDKHQADYEAVIRTVRYQVVVLQQGGISRTFSGTAQAAVESTLSFKVSGTVMEGLVEVGNTVMPGDLLARVDSQDYRVKVQEAEAGLAQARANLRNAEATYDRTRGLYENRNASQSDLDSSRADAESARAAVRAIAQQLEAARLQLSYTRLSAPQKCSIAATYIKENENVQPGQDVVRLNCGECVEVEVSIPETFIERVDNVAHVTARFSAIGDTEYPAEITEIGVASGGTTFPVTVQLTGDCPQIRSGMASDVTFFGSEEAEYRGIIVPTVSVGEDETGHYVYVLETDEQDRWFVRRRSVEVGEPTHGGLSVLDGLVEGELVVTAGVRRIENGMQVKLLTD